MKQLVIFLPGIMGSELYQGKELVWPGPPDSLILPYKLMKQLLDPDLTVGDVIRKFAISDQYVSLLTKLAAAGFSEDNGRLKVCAYDWRKQNEDAAERLASLIDMSVAGQGGDLEITLIAHSMGGLVSRFYLESGLFATRSGYSAVQNLFTLATPHRGAPLALTAALGMEKRLFLNRDQVKELVNRHEFPSLYQLLPPEGDEFAWDDRDREDLYKPLSVYDSSLKLGLSVALGRASLLWHRCGSAAAPTILRRFFEL
jgi:phospholipase A1